MQRRDLSQLNKNNTARKRNGEQNLQTKQATLHCNRLWVTGRNFIGTHRTSGIIKLTSTISSDKLVTFIIGNVLGSHMPVADEN